MKSFIIRLKENNWSSEISMSCILQARKFDLDIKIFDAVYGNDAEKVFNYHGVKKYPQFLKRDTPGVKGCAASHFLLWKKCVEESKTFIILEHDAFMIRELPKQIEDNFIDVCKLDSANPFLKDYEQNFKLNEDVTVVPYDLNWGYKKIAAPYGGYFLGAWAYIIKPHAANKLIDCFRYNGWVPADKQFGEKILDLKTTNSTIFRIHPLYNYCNIKEKSLTRNL